MCQPTHECRCKNSASISTEPNRCCNCGGWLKNKLGGEQRRAGRLSEEIPFSPKQAREEQLAVMQACGEGLVDLARWMSASRRRAHFRCIPGTGR